MAVELCPSGDLLVAAVVRGEVKAIKEELEKGRSVDARDLENGRTLLSWAAGNGYDDAVQFLLDRGANTNAPDLRGRTALLWAAANGHGSIVQQLLAAGANFERRDISGQTPLIFAAQTGSDSVVRHVLEAGASTDVQEWRYGRTALSWAAENGSEKTVKKLLNAKAEVDLADKLNRTPMSWAAMNGHAGVVKLLLQWNASTKVKDKEYDRSPLLWAIKCEQTSVIQILKDISDPEIGYGLAPRPIPASSDRLDALQELFRTIKPDFDWRKTQGGDLLIWAIQNDREEDITFLIEQGADLNAQSEDGLPILSHAINAGFFSVVKLLLERDVSPDILDGSGRTPLSWAAEGGHLEIVKLLLERHVEINFRDEDEMTPLLWAALGGHEHVVAALLEGGADPTAMDNNGCTPMSFAIDNGPASLVRLLLEKESLTDEGMEESPLVRAVANGDIDLVELLLQHGADPYSDAYSNVRLPPLVLAASNGREDIMSLLLERDAASAQVKKENTWRALIEASYQGKLSVVKLLLEQCSFDEADWTDKAPLEFAHFGGHYNIAAVLEPYFPDKS
ncbi:hypothetical protein J7T55_002368 [Diaporthe amygdali]|uniref:uncharacterized protein n=1 Tax=Phomopsis amygdali TaxID=1214568 RepID=UPI0022FEFA8C|nr:uncharacterized protein J7T55_002368 [Diaporthe amygdali]KAJ0121859.1 hypothetical protein J7T55_002368 [Diaporthe amygdali]